MAAESKPYFQLKEEDFPLCLVVGNEITGVSKEIMHEADMAIEIPMFAISSLSMSLSRSVSSSTIAFAYSHRLTETMPT